MLRRMGDHERVLREILFPAFETDRYHHEVELSPTSNELVSFAALLASDDPSEERLQAFLTSHPSFLTAPFGFADSSTLAFITKPRIGTQFVADFLVMQANQGGFVIHLIELEPSSSPLFTEKLTPARRYQAAIGQIQEWQQWIAPNVTTFVRDAVALAKSLKQWPARDDNGSFRVTTADGIDSAYRAFAGDELPAIDYVIVCGRWAKLTGPQRKRLVMLNRENKYRTFTYDQIARSAYVRPLTDWDGGPGENLGKAYGRDEPVD
jgi:hypothetical protein